MIHNFQELSTALGAKDKQLAAFVDSSNENFEAFAQEEGSLREALQLFPGALSQTATTLQHTNSLAKELGPTLEGLRPFARELAPSLRRQQPFLRDTTPIIRDQIRPFARDVQPTVKDLRTATNDLAPVTPGLTRSFKVLNNFFNTLAYDPPGDTQSFLFWSGWAAHSGTTLTSLQDAHGPMLRGIVLASCTQFGVLAPLIQGNPQLGMLTKLANFPDDRARCPNNLTGFLSETPVAPPPVRMIKQAPSVGRILTMVAFALSCFGILIFLWLSFGGSVPLQPEGYRVNVAFPEATQLAQEAEVRISGVKVGKVRKVEPNEETGLTDAVVEIDSRYAPISKDARAMLRQKTLLGRDLRRDRAGQPGRRHRGHGGRRRQPAARPGGRHRPARRDPAHVRPGDARALLHLARPAGPRRPPGTARRSTTRSAISPRSPRTPTTC